MSREKRSWRGMRHGSHTDYATSSLHQLSNLRAGNAQAHRSQRWVGPVQNTETLAGHAAAHRGQHSALECGLGQQAHSLARTARRTGAGDKEDQERHASLFSLQRWRVGALQARLHRAGDEQGNCSRHRFSADARQNQPVEITRCSQTKEASESAISASLASHGRLLRHQRADRRTAPFCRCGRTGSAG